MWEALAVGAAGGLTSGYFSAKSQQQANAMNQKMARETNQANERIAAEQMKFQADMSNTAYQRSMEDMKKAGLNPMLAYSQGGASTPAGAGIPAQQPAPAQSADYGEVIKRGVNSAMEAARVNRELKASDSQIALNEAAKENQISQKLLNSNSAKVAEINAETAKAELPAIRASSAAAAEKAKYDKQYAPFDAVNNRVNTATGSLSNAMSVLRPRINIGRDRSTDTIMDSKGEVVYEGPRQKNPLYKHRWRP